jgi:hypothetical protein
VTLLAELDDFFTDHHHCGDLTPASTSQSSGSRATAEASMARRASEDDHAGRD